MKHFPTAKNLFIKHWPVVVLTFISLVLCVLNYTPGTILSGWDTLHPEFNFPLNLKRAVFGVFRPEQGLGAVAAHSHMADLPRILFLWHVSPLVPMYFLRYLYIFLMLVIGPIGIYYLTRFLITRNQTSSHKAQDLRIPTLAAFLAGLWYLCNLGTLQQFFVPFEMFVVEYGFLPWLFYFSLRYLHEEKRTKGEESTFSRIAVWLRIFADKLRSRHSNSRAIKQFNNSPLLLFALCSLLASPMAYAATLWYMFITTLGVFLFIQSVFGILKRNFTTAKRSLILILVTLLTNAYWLLPNLYFVTTQSAAIQNANINKLFSQQAFLYNKEFGTIGDILLLKSFFFDWSIYNGKDFESLLNVWIKYLHNPFIMGVGFLLAGVMILGIISSLWKSYSYRFALLGTLAFILVFLFNDNPPTSFVFHLFGKLLPILREALRFPHNKVQILYMLLFAIYFGYGNFFLLNTLSKTLGKVKQKAVIGYSLLLSILLLTFFIPAFEGQLISPYMRIKIPKAYFSLFSFMNRESEDARAAYLPVHSFWGWEYHNWGNGYPGFQGAGFLWFGMNQPLLHRDFDRWSPYNEQFYKEFSFAVYAKNEQLLSTVAKKYNTKYLILDKSVIAPDEAKSVLFYSELSKMLSNTSFFTRRETFGGFLTVYEVKNVQNTEAALLTNPTSISPVSQTMLEDAAYKTGGAYISTVASNTDTVYPFRTQIDNQNRLLSKTYSLTQDGVVLHPLLSTPLPRGDALGFKNEETQIPVRITVQRQDSTLMISLYPILPFNGVKEQPNPIKITAPLPEKKTLLQLTVNKNETFSFSSELSSDALVLGKSFLSSTKVNSVDLFSGSPDEEESIDILSKNYSLRPCTSLEEGQVFGINQVKDSSFNLFAKNTPACLILPLSQIFKKENVTERSLLATTIAYAASASKNANDLTSACIANLKNGACIHYLSQSLSRLPEDTTYQRTFYAQISRSEIDTLGLRISLDASNIQSLSQASFAKLSFTISKPSLPLIITPEELNLIFSSSLKNATIEDGVLVPYSGDGLLSKDITSFPRTSGLCQENPLVVTGKAQREIVEAKGAYIHYRSEEIPQCDHFSYTNVSHNQAHLLLITSRNLSGLPLTICLTNRTSKRCDVYARTTPSKEFTTDVFLVPPSDDGIDGYDVNINNLGVKGTPATNDLASIQLIPFPFAWLTNLSSSGKSPQQAQQIVAKNVNQYRYELEIPKNAQKNTILALNESYASGWQAYIMANSKWQMANGFRNSFPFFFGKKLQEHVLVNNWANGWLLDSTLDAKPSTLIIVFWPQYFFFIGVILTLSILILLTLKRK